MTEQCRLMTKEQWDEYQILKHQLEIAKEALDFYASGAPYYENLYPGETARQSLTQLDVKGGAK